MTRAMRLRSRVWLRVLLFHDPGVPDKMARLLHVTGGHMAFVMSAGRWDAYCLDDETHEEHVPVEMQWYGGGRLDCCDSSERLAPEALAFCRARLRDSTRPWLRWYSTWEAP